MDVRFCDLCNESVPDADIVQGRAVLRSGRLICAACEHAMRGGGASAEARPSPRPRPVGGEARRAEVLATAPPAEAPPERGGGLFLGIVALLFAGGAAAVFLAERGGERDARDAGLAQVESDLARLDARLAGLAGDLREETLARTGRLEDAVERARGELAEQLAELRSRLDERARDVGDLVERLDALARHVEEEARAASDRRERLVADLAVLRRDLEALALRVGALESAPSPGPGGGPDGAPRQGDPAWTPLLAGLQSEDSGERWNAVATLGETGDPAVVPYVVPMLGDENVFVRMAAARVLGDLGSPRAIGALIDALEDPEAAVRDAAVISLRALTGEDLGFDPLGSPAERAKRVAAWRKWWERARKDLLGDS